ncbi:hypothetical protein Hanom_Chr02g00136741 [Helianthus anomalus]
MHNLSKMKFGGNKLLVNVALFARENGDFKPDVANRRGAKVEGGVQDNVQEGNLKVRGFNSVKKGVSFLDILTNSSHVASEEDMGAGFRRDEGIKSFLKMAEFEGVSLQYLGGLSVLISFDKEDSIKRLLEENILGVPPHLVSREVFDVIGSKYDKVVKPSQFQESDGNLTYDRLGNLLDTGNRINGVLNLRWQDKRYKIWVVEENDQWIPDFLEDDEDSVITSSELGGFMEEPVLSTPGICGSVDMEDDEFVEAPDVEIDKKKGTNEIINGDVMVSVIVSPEKHWCSEGDERFKSQRDKNS